MMPRLTTIIAARVPRAILAPRRCRDQASSDLQAPDADGGALVHADWPRSAETGAAFTQAAGLAAVRRALERGLGRLAAQQAHAGDPVEGER